MAPCLAVMIAAALSVSPARAATGDMFADHGMIVSNRPWVPSDRFHHADMFPASAPYLRTDKDMFDDVTPPGNPDVEDHFSAHLRSIPDEPLFHWPKEAPYP